MTRHTWSATMTELLVELYPHIPTDWIAKAMDLPIKAVYAKARALGLKKTETFLSSELAGRIQAGSNIGANGRFQKGLTPWNKGKSHVAGGRSAETRFKPGHLGGKARNQYKPIGSERISKDGYLERKINDDLPLQKRWRAVHLIEWEAANGPLPAGHAIAFKDGDKTNRSPDNLELITRAELMRRNTIHNYPKEIAQLVQLRGAITRQINRKERNNNGQ